MKALVAIAAGLAFVFCAHASSRSRANEPNLEAELRRLDSYLHAQRGPASEAAFAAFESAIGVLKEDLAKTREQLPKQLATVFETSVASNAARVVDESDDYKVADYRCYVSAMRTLELSESLIVLPLRAKKLDLDRLDVAERQYDELLRRFESRSKAKPDDAPDSVVSVLLRRAGHDVFASGFGIVLTETQCKELEALLDAHADHWKNATSLRQRGEAKRAGLIAVTDFFVPLDRSSGGGLAAQLATLAWSNRHGELEQSVRDGARESEKAETAAIQAAAQRDARAPEPKPAEPEPTPLP
ncbi:MAG: hypothetical protein U0836_24265 [Pirellulales bacterium]